MVYNTGMKTRILGKVAMKPKVMALAVTLCVGLTARDLLWNGSGSTTWSTDASAVNWTDVSTGTATCYAEGDNVLFDDTQSPNIHSVTLGAAMSPGTVVFNIGSATPFDVLNNTFFNATRTVKRGTGMVQLNLTAGCTAGNPVDIEAGILAAVRANAFGSYAPTAGATREWTIKDGAELRVTQRNCFGKCDAWSISAGGNCVRLKKGGVFSLYDPAQSSHVGNSVWELYLEGGEVDFSAKGASAGVGLLLINHMLTLSGDTATVISNKTGYSNQGIAINKLFDTTFVIENVTGDNAPDLTLDAPLANSIDAETRARLIKQGAGTLLLLDRTEAFTADVLIKNGAIRLDYHPGVADAGKNEFGASAGKNTTLGDLTKAGRKITIADYGRLELMERNMLTSYSYGETGNNNIQTEIVVTNGGTIALSPQHAGGGMCCGPLTIADGNIEYSLAHPNHTWGWGVLAVRGTMKVIGNHPFSMAVNGKNCYHILYRNKETVFDVADITGDSASDFVTDLPFVIPMEYSVVTNEQGEVCSYGFVKRGLGTMQMNGNANISIGMNGEASVEEGTLAVNGDIRMSSVVTVAAGAYLSGTGTVNNVTVAAGGGFRQTVGNDMPLNIVGNLSIGANPVLRIDNPAGLPAKSVRAVVFAVTGTVTGEENLAGASIYLDGELQNRGAWLLECVAGRCTVKAHSGTMIVIK